MVNRKKKTYSSYTNNYDKGVKEYHYKKSSSHREDRKVKNEV